MTSNSVAEHYAQTDLIQRIEAGLAQAGVTPANASVADLGPVDEFHTGGRAATEHLLRDLPIAPGDRVLDIGCGIGGTSRLLADRYGAKVTGIDLTPAHVAAGEVLNGWVALADEIELLCGDASELPMADDTFDLAVMLHVGMNIQDKKALFSDVNRVLKVGGRFAIYDVMRRNDSSIAFPVPWASDASMSFLESSDVYRDLLAGSGFDVERVDGRGEFARTFFQKMQTAPQLTDSQPAVGLHLLIGPSIKEKMQNFSHALFDGIVEPTEIIARKV